MKVFLVSKILFFQILFIGSLSAQNLSNCANAMEVCDGNDLAISLELTEVQPTDSVIDLCGLENFFIQIDSNDVWLKYTFSTAGDFIFNIIPDSIGVDVDFVVLKSEMDNCYSLRGIRCMFSGDFDPNSIYYR